MDLHPEAQLALAKELHEALVCNLFDKFSLAAEAKTRNRIRNKADFIIGLIYFYIYLTDLFLF